MGSAFDCTANVQFASGKRRGSGEKKKRKKKLLAYKIIVLEVVEVGVAVLCVEQEHLRLAKASEGKEGTGGPHCSLQNNWKRVVLPPSRFRRRCCCPSGRVKGGSDGNAT